MYDHELPYDYTLEPPDTDNEDAVFDAAHEFLWEGRALEDVIECLGSMVSVREDLGTVTAFQGSHIACSELDDVIALLESLRDGIISLRWENG